DDMNWLYPNYVPATRSFTCPSTVNEIRETNTSPIVAGLVAPPSFNSTAGNQSGVAGYADRIHSDSFYLRDLTTNAGGKNQPFGSSYEVSGYLNSYLVSGLNFTGFKRKTQFTCPNYVTTITLLPYSRAGQQIGPVDILIIYDADDRFPSDPA